MMRMCIYCSGSYFKNSLMLEIERECTKKYTMLRRKKCNIAENLLFLSAPKNVHSTNDTII